MGVAGGVVFEDELGEMIGSAGGGKAKSAQLNSARRSSLPLPLLSSPNKSTSRRNSPFQNPLLNQQLDRLLIDDDAAL